MVAQSAALTARSDSNGINVAEQIEADLSGGTA